MKRFAILGLLLLIFSGCVQNNPQHSNTSNSSTLNDTLNPMVSIYDVTSKDNLSNAGSFCALKNFTQKLRQGNIVCIG